MEGYQEEVLTFLRGEMDENERRAFEERLARSSELREELSRCRELLEVLEAASDRATARRVERQIDEALARRASDIHLLPDARELAVYLRIDGALVPLEQMGRTEGQGVIDRWKAL